VYVADYEVLTVMKCPPNVRREDAVYVICSFVMFVTSKLMLCRL
jgi:hypothetical protein